MMSQINDAIHTVLGPGQLNDLLLDYYNANNGVPTLNDINGAEQEFLIFQGAKDVAGNNLNDLWSVFLNTPPQSLTGSVDDMKLAWWSSGASLV